MLEAVAKQLKFKGCYVVYTLQVLLLPNQAALSLTESKYVGYKKISATHAESF